MTISTGEASATLADALTINPADVTTAGSIITDNPVKPIKAKPRRRKGTQDEDDDPSKRRCVSTACIACRKRKSKCDGNTPACAACSQVYNTECIYDPNSDHRRKGVYKNDLDSLKTRNTTLHTLISAILNYPEDDVPDLVREIRTCESLDDVAERIVAKEHGIELDEAGDTSTTPPPHAYASSFESNLYGNMGNLRLEEGSLRYIGGTSNLIHIDEDDDTLVDVEDHRLPGNAILSWTEVTDDAELINHLLNMYFTWHYTYFTTLSKHLFYKDFKIGKLPSRAHRRSAYCSSLLVNAMLALGCHFTALPGSRDVAEDSSTAGDHFFREAKRLLMEEDELEKPRLTTVQALALMSVREAGCAREAKGWVYSGMSFRMAQDMGLQLDAGQLNSHGAVNTDEVEEDARRITFWGCFLFDKCWSNYLGRLPQIPRSMVTTPKFDVFPDEDASAWSAYTDSGLTQATSQPARTRAVALEISKLCEISNDLMQSFYNPTDMDKTKAKQAELKKLSDIHTRLEAWRRELPKELEPREGGLPNVIVMHMFFQLLFIHLFKPFLKYTQSTSPLPSNVSPRKLCTQAAAMISKLLRLYKRSHGLRQICNIAVYIVHSACTIHLLNLPDKNARRDITHGVKHLEEIAESWLCARRSLGILNLLARKWNVELPSEAETVLARSEAKFGPYKRDAQSPSSDTHAIAQPNMNYLYSLPQPMPPTGQQLDVFTNGGAPILRQTMMVNGRQANSTAAVMTAMQTPPQSAASMLAQQYPSASSTPPSGHAYRSDETIPVTVGSVSSPSGMFGGIDQLLQQSQDWAYRDQAQFGTGFGNWINGSEDVSPTWLGVSPTMTSTSHQSPHARGKLQGATDETHGSRSAAAEAHAVLTAAGLVTTVDGGGQSRFRSELRQHSIQFDAAMSYDEDEWYQ